MGLRALQLSDATLSPNLRTLLTAAIPSSVRRVTLTVPTSPCAKAAFNAVRHALGVSDRTSAEECDLRRLQLLSQCLLVVETSHDWRSALEQHGLALFLFPPVAGEILEFTNKMRGRLASSSQRNALAHFYANAMALCRWLHVAEQLRQPLRDWYETKSKALERAARSAKRMQLQAAVDPPPRSAVEEVPHRLTSLDHVNEIPIERMFSLPSPLRRDNFFMLLVCSVVDQGGVGSGSAAGIATSIRDCRSAAHTRGGREVPTWPWSVD